LAEESGDGNESGGRVDTVTIVAEVSPSKVETTFPKKKISSQLRSVYRPLVGGSDTSADDCHEIEEFCAGRHEHRTQDEIAMRPGPSKRTASDDGDTWKFQRAGQHHNTHPASGVWLCEQKDAILGGKYEKWRWQTSFQSRRETFKEAEIEHCSFVSGLHLRFRFCWLETKRTPIQREFEWTG
jgi:hypothetical protein